MKIVFLMDPLERIDIHRDTTYVIMWEAQRRGHSIFHLLPQNLYIDTGRVMGRIFSVRLQEGEKWFCFDSGADIDLKEMDVIFMRADPPFDMDYLYSTYLLGLIEKDLLIINSPRGIREANEKLYAFNFPEVIPESIVTNDIKRLKVFLKRVGGRMVVKPLNSCGGSGVFAIFSEDKNMNAILEMATKHEKEQIIAQRYIPEIREGDKRLIILNGEPIGAVNRVPSEDEHRGNIHVGARCEKAPITERDLYISNLISDRLKEDGLYLVGLDIIGGLITEINVTSPTGVQEINNLNGVRLEEKIVDFVEEKAG
jgi:glutathione synthase